MADLLLELFSEEIPARMQAEAEGRLASEIQKQLGMYGVPYGIIKYYSTPRRLAVAVKDIPTQQEDMYHELKGPKINAPEAAIQGFLKKSGLKLEQLEQRDGIYIALTHQKGKPTAELLKELTEKILLEFPWPKSMRWGANETSWVRPLHSILCIFDGKTVPVEFAGVKASNTTRGHRFLAPETITIKTASEYEAALKSAKVIADRDARKLEILRQANEAASGKGLVLKNDEGLLEEVTGLVEWPVVLVGTIDKNYMDLPKEVLVSEMRAHQKYFALENKDGTFSDKFLITSNMVASDGGKAIIAGNERVLRARLADGRFFWDQDRKKKLEDWAEGLKSVTFHAKLGTVADKVERVEKLALELMSHVDPGLRRDDIKRAASLCKADLVTGMVGEFPELQGVMGRYYAELQGEKKDVADAIRDHYLPLGPSSPIPTSPVSICVALADKFDTLISMFAAGEKPTGSKDPFALRRAALGIIRIILENNIRLPLLPLFKNAPLKEIAIHKAHEKLVEKTEAALEHETHKVGKYLTVNETASEDISETAMAELGASLLSFFHDRLIVQMKDSGIRHDVIKAVIANGDDDLVRIVARAKAVQAFLETDDGKNLLAGYKRAANILGIEEKKDGKKYNVVDLDESSLNQPEERALRFAYSSKQNEELLLWEKNEQYPDIMKFLATYRKPVDQFFDKILVNDKDENIRANRLRLLASIRDFMNRIADFSLIEGDSKEQKKAA